MARLLPYSKAPRIATVMFPMFMTCCYAHCGLFRKISVFGGDAFFDETGKKNWIVTCSGYVRKVLKVKGNLLNGKKTA